MKRPTRMTKQSKAIDRKYQEAKCRECTVVVTRMDFAKILGKFTKVKIQYESNSPKDKQKALREVSSPNSNARLKSNENGMVLIHRTAYKEHPVKEILSPKKQNNLTKSPNNLNSKQKTIINNNNILKENNGLKKTPTIKDKIIKDNVRRKDSSHLKHYAIIFTNPKKNNNFNEANNKTTLLDLLPSIDKNILPSNDWSIDYLPHSEEPKEDKVYDRIAAELEDLMYNEKSIIVPAEKSVDTENKDDFPSILDILNDNPSDINQKKVEHLSNAIEVKSDLASSDVEAMLLDDSDASKPVNSLIEDVVHLTDIVQTDEKSITNLEEPGSPSILDEALQKGIAEHLPDKDVVESTQKEAEKENAPSESKIVPMETDGGSLNDLKQKVEIDVKSPAREITDLVFKYTKDGSCKTVTCPKTLKYTIELYGKPIELVGAPKFISNREDLKVLLQIVNESELESSYVLQ